MDVAIVDAGGANLGSVVYALERLGARPRITCDPDIIGVSPRVLLPGVGAAHVAMARLHAAGLVEALRSLTQPVLGICLGMQLLFEHSDEGDTPCLGVIPGRVTRLAPAAGIRVPHMGWNALELRTPDAPLLRGIHDGNQTYFVHSYAAPVGEHTLASCTHASRFSAVVQRGNFAGAQFHPERSAEVGAALLRNFLEDVPQ